MRALALVLSVWLCGQLLSGFGTLHAVHGPEPIPVKAKQRQIRDTFLFSRLALTDIAFIDDARSLSGSRRNPDHPIVEQRHQWRPLAGGQDRCRRALPGRHQISTKGQHMSTYLVEIIRDTLTDFQDRVRDEEAGASAFAGNRVVSLDGGLVNLASFTTLPVGQLPMPASFAEVGSLPADAVPLWTGVVLLGTTTAAVSLFRQA